MRDMCGIDGFSINTWGYAHMLKYIAPSELSKT
jgi:hypothetical protein